ncbi:DUF4142 domain-containing protein [Niabella drilacis]|uniref:Putative membrane protein n=1 Tax=Niabella drilacis (strain DSM 25811 / CCM 8410 / CCUG 62505 / LMG 26954 / E90) TaxID=1285928 RepID=A0A1G6PK23_NIADE|nr:DUF4142 domain-containing protein [Niabella drilacis]SDC80409.1 putative membrane protein [Niabella drilacis]
MKATTVLKWRGVALMGTLFFAINSFGQSTPKLTDPEIASVAVTANQIDVDYAGIAQRKSADAAILNFAKTMKTDHLGVIDMATKLVKKLKVTPKTNSVTKSLLEGAKKTKATLNGKSGKAFNTAYMDNEVAYHQAVIDAVEKVLIPQAQNAELKALLVQVLPALKAHLEHAKMVQKALK